MNHNYAKQRTLKHKNTQNGSKSANDKSQTMTFWTRWSKVLFPKRSVKTIDGSEKRNRQLAFELQNSHVYEKPSKSQNRGSYAQAQSPNHLCGKPLGDSGENSNRRHRTVRPGGIFREKVILSEIYIYIYYFFLRFCWNSWKFLFYLSAIISARLFPRGKRNNAQDGGFKTRYSSKPFVT